MAPFIQTLFLFSLGLGTLITFSSSNWILAWMGLEINTLAIIPLMTQHHTPRGTEAATKYFLTQAAAAALVLFAAFINASLTSQWEITTQLQEMPATIMILALCLKLGMAPMHFWLPEVIQGLDLTTAMILSTWQKLAPFSILYLIMPSQPHLILSIAICSIFVGGFGALNQTQLRKILAYSSIAHLGWISAALILNHQIALLVLLLYIPTTFVTFMALKCTSSTTINALATHWTKFPPLWIMFLMILLSLGGLPPLSGFMPKWLVLQELANKGLLLLALLMTLGALLSLFFYLRLAYALLTTISPNSSNSSIYSRTENENITPLMPLFIVTSTMALPTTPLVLALLS
uniref:NADH dehydrogenase subunit 2 n=1 Tax=Bregmaceros mcclellandi TaxID=2831535 RepID=UPI001EE0114B|nr:NADH dehydrogenase subunit 2 [Bregmaceros mcclellandi]UIX24715.1 NADH dehydrogenase subunit 2 [Bregmaceros mcclellandi]